MIDNSPRLLRKGVRLYSTLNKINGLRGTDETPERNVLLNCFLKDVQSQVRGGRLQYQFAEFVIHRRCMGGHTLHHAIYRRAAIDSRLHGMRLESDEKVSEDSNTLKVSR